MDGAGLRRKVSLTLDMLNLRCLLDTQVGINRWLDVEVLNLGENWVEDVHLEVAIVYIILKSIRLKILSE